LTQLRVITYSKRTMKLPLKLDGQFTFWPFLLWFAILFTKRIDTHVGAHEREQMINKDGERDSKDANSGYNMLFHFLHIACITVSFRTIHVVIFYSIPKENKHTCTHAREQMIKTHNMYKCGGMVHLMMQPCTYTL
jgi:hypothetical protein